MLPNQKNIFLIGGFILVVLTVAFLGRHQTGSYLSGPNALQSPAPVASSNSAAEQATVKITADGFSPQTVTIKAGGTVTWINSDSSLHNVNSDPHPVHTDYPPLNLGTFQPGQSMSLTFPTAGTHGYHDHLNPQLRGTVVVQ